MDELRLPVRPDLDDVTPYVSPQLPARYRMNTNESPFPPPPDLLEAVTERLGASALNRYPDRDANVLLDALAEATGWRRDGIWIANGSNEVLLHLFLTFGGPQRTSLTFEPTYSLHTLIARIAGNRTLQIPRRSSDFGVDPEALTDAVRETDIALFCHPNNPTGSLEDRAIIERTTREAPLVVVDEAYIEFASDGSSVADLLPKHRNLVVVRTFSKAWSLAGVRLGYMLADPSIVATMAKVRLPYGISTFTQLVGAAALSRQEEARQRISAIVAERDRLSEGVASLGLRVHPSDANFVLFEVGDPHRTQQVWDSLMERGVLVRNYASSRHLQGCLRVTAGMPEETDAFLTALKEVL